MPYKASFATPIPIENKNVKNYGSQGWITGDSIQESIERGMKKSLKELQDLTGEDQPSLLRKLVDIGLAEVRIDLAVDRYIKDKALLEKSSSIAGVSLWRFLDELRRRNVALKYSMSDAEWQIATLLASRR
jgi:predicted HTH domain antitoxin